MIMKNLSMFQYKVKVLWNKLGQERKLVLFLLKDVQLIKNKTGHDIWRICVVPCGSLNAVLWKVLSIYLYI